MKNKNNEQNRIQRLQDKVKALGGELPEPWPWAVNRRYKRRGLGGRGNVVEVDSALYGLQLLELIEDLEKQRK